MSRTDVDLEDRERRLDEAVAVYLQFQAAGNPIDRTRFLEQHRDLAEELAGFLEDLDHLDRAALPAQRDPVPPDLASEFSDETVVTPVMTDSTIRHALDSQIPSNRYRLLRFLARGGMGEVWSAEDTHVGRPIAVKRILTNGNAGTVAEERFLFESQIMGQLEHPSIVPLHDLGRDENGALLAVMKLVKGRSLKEHLVSFHATKSGADWPHQVAFRHLLQVFASICRAVAYAHSRGVLHRDIKPDNIMLGSYGEALLLDWGLAKILNDIQVSAIAQTESERVHVAQGISTATRAGAVMGSPAYMPPEIAAGHADAADERADSIL